MSKKLGGMEIVCDAPVYEVVQACSAFGFHQPEDVRWCQSDAAPANIKTPLFRPQRGACRCGQTLPLLERFSFSFKRGQHEAYYLGQCERCHTVYWIAD